MGTNATTQRSVASIQQDINEYLPAASGAEIAKFLEKKPGFSKAVADLEGKVRAANGDYDLYLNPKPDKNGLQAANGNFLTAKAFNRITNNLEDAKSAVRIASLFIHPTTNKIYSQDAQQNLMSSAEKKGAFTEGLSNEDFLERAININNLCTAGFPRDKVTREIRRRTEYITELRQAEERDDKIERMIASQKIEWARDSNSQSPHTRRIRAERAVASVTLPAIPSYQVVIKDPKMQEFYAKKIAETEKTLPGLMGNNPLTDAVESAYSEKIDTATAIIKNPYTSGADREKAGKALAGNKRKLEEFQEPFNTSVAKGKNGAGTTEASNKIIAAAPLQIVPPKISKPIAPRLEPIPAQVIKSEYFVTTSHPVRDIRIKKDDSKLLRLDQQVPIGLKVGEKFNLTADVSIERIGSDKGYKYNLIFHNPGKYQVGGAIHTWGTNFGTVNFNVQEKGVVQNLHENKPQVANVPVNVSPATPREEAQRKPALERIVAPNSPQSNIAPVSPPPLVEIPKEGINQSFQELNSKVLFLDQHKHFLSTEQASQWYWYVDARQKEIKRLRESGDITQLEAEITKTKKNLDTICQYLEDRAKTSKALGYQVHEVVELDAYGRQVKMLDIYWSANNVQSIQSSQANYENFYTQQGNLVSRHRTFAGGWVSYCNQNGQAATFYAHDFNYKGLSFK